MRRRRIFVLVTVACLLIGAPLLIAHGSRPDAATEPRGVGGIISVSGPETAGSVIVINNRRVRLPSDAYVDAYFVTVDCIPMTPCPDPPVYVIRRGNAEIVVEERTGRVWRKEGPDSAFDFLQGVLREDK